MGIASPVRDWIGTGVSLLGFVVVAFAAAGVIRRRKSRLRWYRVDSGAMPASPPNGPTPRPEPNRVETAPAPREQDSSGYRLPLVGTLDGSADETARGVTADSEYERAPSIEDHGAD
jgi:hypothetical protein